MKRISDCRAGRKPEMAGSLEGAVYMQAIFCTRRSWRPPSNAVWRKMRTMACAKISGTNRAGKAMTFALLC